MTMDSRPPLPLPPCTASTCRYVFVRAWGRVSVGRWMCMHTNINNVLIHGNHVQGKRLRVEIKKTKVGWQ